MVDLKQTIAYLYQREGKSTLTNKEIELTVSHGLGWFNPEEARRMVEVAVNSGLLTEDRDGLKPSFDYKKVELPLELKPTKDILELPPQEPIFLRIVNRISDETQLDNKIIIAEINQKVAQLKIELEVAALLIARKHDIDVSEFFDDVEHEVISRIAKS
jgi:hypothetical protein